MGEKFTPQGNSSHNDNIPEIEIMMNNTARDMDLVKDYGFVENNKYRLEKGLKPYDREEYDKVFLEMRKESVVKLEQQIIEHTKEIEEIKASFSEHENKILNLKEIIKRATSEENDIQKAENFAKTLTAYEQTFGEDALLEKIVKIQNYIEKNKNLITKYKSDLKQLEGENKV